MPTNLERLRHRLQLMVGIQPGEASRVAILFLYSIAAVGGVVTIGPAATEALYLSALPASALPYIFILPAISTIAALLLYNRVAAGMRLDQAVVGSNILLLSGVVLFRLLLSTRLGSSSVLLAALFMLMEFASTLIILQFWNFAGQLFNARQAKRLFGIIGAGGTLAAPAAGFSLVGLVQLIGVANLLWVVALALLFCAVCAALLGQSQSSAPPAAAAPPAHAAAGQFGHELRLVGQSPLLRAILALTILGALLINIAVYQFYQALQQRFAGSGDDMAAYLGAFEFWSGVAAAVVQIALTGRIMQRFGVFVALLIFPLSVALGASLSILLGGIFWTIALLRAADPVFHGTVNTAALNVLYLPIPGSLRERAKELFEGAVAASFGLAGLAFLILQHVPGWDDRYYSIPLLIVAAAWLALVGRTRREYTRALVDSLRRRVLDLAGATIDITDEMTVRVLANALRQPDELHVLHTLQLIGGAAPAIWDAHVVDLLGHTSPTIRLQAIRYLGRAGNTAYLAPIAEFLAAPDGSLRAAAIAAYCAMAGPAAGQRIGPLLDAAEPNVRGAAVAGLIQHGTDGTARRAEAVLDHMLASRDPAERLEGARAIGLVRSPALAARLVPCFVDSSRDVRLSAIQAAGELGTPELARELIRALESRASASAASLALAKYSGAIEAQLGQGLDNPLTGAVIPHILERVGTRAAIEQLLAHFQARDDTVRGEIYRALARLRSNQGELDLPEATVRSALLAEIRQGYTWAALRAGVAASGAGGLLDEALQIRLNRTFDRIFFLLMLLSPDHTAQIRRVRQALESAPQTTRALAIELLDNLTERRIKDLLLPLIEAPTARLLEIAEKQLALELTTPAEQLRSLAHSSDRWLRSCAIVQIGALRQTDLADAILAALVTEDGLLHETALSVYHRLMEEPRSLALAAKYVDSGFPNVRRYARARLDLPAQQLFNGGRMPLSTIERVLLLKGAELFNHIAGEDLVAVALIAQEVTFPAGTTLIRQSEPGDCLYIIVVGDASINIRGVGTVARRTAGDSLGEMGLLSRQPRSADCVALTDLTALRIERDDFWEVLAEMPALALGVIETLSQRLDEAVANLQRAVPYTQAVPAERDRDGLK